MVKKQKYQDWKAAFFASIDSAPSTGEYKVLQLRQDLSGEALQLIEILRHSAMAMRVQNNGWNEIMGVSVVKLSFTFTLKTWTLEQFSDLLDIATVNLQEAGQNHELGNGSLYAKFNNKLPQSMLAKCHRWCFEHIIAESVASLRTYVIQEFECQIIASETIHGFADNIENNQPRLGTKTE